MESARRACQETAAAIQPKVEACANSVDVAVPMHSTAVEHFTVTEIAAVQLSTWTPVPHSRQCQRSSASRGSFPCHSWKQNKLKRSTCESSHESGAGSVVPLHAGCDPRCQGSRNGGTESERALRELRVASVVAERRLRNTWRMRSGTSHSRAARTRHDKTEKGPDHPGTGHDFSVTPKPRSWRRALEGWM